LASIRRQLYASPVSMSGKSRENATVYCARNTSSASSERRRLMFWMSARDTSSSSTGSLKFCHHRSLRGSAASRPGSRWAVKRSVTGSAGSW